MIFHSYVSLPEGTLQVPVALQAAFVGRFQQQHPSRRWGRPEAQLMRHAVQIVAQDLWSVANVQQQKTIYLLTCVYIYYNTIYYIILIYIYIYIYIIWIWSCRLSEQWTSGCSKADPPSSPIQPHDFYRPTPKKAPKNGTAKLHGNGSKPCSPGEHQNSW